MPRSSFHLKRPQTLTSCVVFASPHSGRDYAWSFMRRSSLSELAIRSSEDAFVDDLIDCAPSFGAPLLLASAPRAFVDLNRDADEFDPALIEGVQKTGHNPRIASGLGVIPRVVANGRAIYRGKLSQIEARKRINEFWHPYHRQLSDLLKEAHQTHGQAILLDFHSMPHEALDSFERAGKPRPDIVLGDRYGASAAAPIVDEIEEVFASEGFSVARNTPFAGAYIVQAYGRPQRNRHAVQIEIDRSLYMNEKELSKNENFTSVKRRISAILAKLSLIGTNGVVPLAAE